MAKKPGTKGDKGVPELIEKTVQVLTWNIAGSKSAAGFANIRSTIAPTLKGLLSAECIVFFQEMSSGVKRVVDWGFEDVFAEVDGGGKREAGVSTPQGGPELSIQAGDILGKEKLRDSGVEREIIDDERLYGRTITITCKDGRRGTEYSCQIAVLSYHAPYKTEDKQTKMVNFFGEMCKLANKLENHHSYEEVLSKNGHLPSKASLSPSFEVQNVITRLAPRCSSSCHSREKLLHSLALRQLNNRPHPHFTSTLQPLTCGSEEKDRVAKDCSLW